MSKVADGTHRAIWRDDDAPTEYTKAWCRDLFEKLTEGGIWGWPSSLLVFRKIGDAMVLIEPTKLDEAQAYNYRAAVRHFGAAGITVTRQQ